MRDRLPTSPPADRPGSNPPTGPEFPVEPLSHSLKQRHLTMLGLGGVIGAGLFVGSGAGIGIAGPAIICSYLLAGALAMLVMRALGEAAREGRDLPQ
ncbi:hypothetical protein ACWDA9_27835, partial [Streptomyces sp. NPDC001193]